MPRQRKSEGGRRNAQASKAGIMLHETNCLQRSRMHAATNNSCISTTAPKPDVIVIGAGIAGIVAAIESARAGARTAIACAGQLFGGSSFYPGTWGLGLIGPASTADEDDLIATILDVGCGVADPDLVATFVRNIRPSIDWLEHDLGVELKRPASDQSAAEVAFIPCFDHTNRIWRGITRDAFTHAASREIERLGITVLEHHELMAIEQSITGDLQGATLFSCATASFVTVPAHALVLAAGGTSGLFERRLTSQDVLGTVHGMAAEAGCELINLEFMQMMPGLVSPKRGLVCNEKTFRYARLADHHDILPSAAGELIDLLETRSGHGPFTARLGDERVDLAIDAAGPEGLALTYHFPERDIPEFVQAFSTWLEQEHGITPQDELRVAMYAHASNGGIRISAHGETGVPGIFACGEATGGMHGADRLGGLSSANGLVFGRRAGRHAAAYAQGHTGSAGQQLDPELALEHVCAKAAPIGAEEARTLTAQLRHLMSTYAMINRTEDGLLEATRQIDELKRRLDRPENAANAALDNAPEDYALGIRLQSQLKLARAMVDAMRNRRESRGSHYRADYPPQATPSAIPVKDDHAHHA